MQPIHKFVFGLVVLSSLAASTSLHASLATSNTNTDAPGPGIADADDDFWRELSLELPAMEELLRVYEARSGSGTVLLATSSDVDQFVAHYLARGLRPDLTTAEVVAALERVKSLLITLNLHPGELPLATEIKFREVLQDIALRLRPLVQ